MKQKSKYRKGRRIGSFKKLVRELEKNGLVIWKPNAPIKGWYRFGCTRRWMAALLIRFLKAGAFYEAHLRKERRKGK